MKKAALLLLSLMSLSTHAADLKAPVGVRPCCAFGVDLKAQLGKVPVPFFSLENVLNSNDVGTHHYNDGSASISGSLLGLADEENGLIFTKLAGFIDTAHVRDTADYTYYLFQLNQRYLGKEHNLELPAELRTRKLTWHAQPSNLSHAEKTEFNAKAAALTAFRLAQWHEIAQWFGMVSVGGFDELASAFSSEDLYSNMLGANLAMRVLIAQPKLTTDQFAKAMNLALKEELDHLQAQPKSLTRKKIQQLDGEWWDSSKRLPNKWAVLFRDYHLALTLTPNYPGAEHKLMLESQFSNQQAIESWLSLELIASDDEAAFSQLPEELIHKRHWTVEDFQTIASFAKQHDTLTLKAINSK